MCNPAWRPLVRADLAALSRIAAEVHPGLPERPEVFEERLRLFPAGCFALASNGAFEGYAISHLWRLYEIPRLDAFLDKPAAAPDCLYLHDVAVKPSARGQGAAAALIERLSDIARARGVAAIALTSVYETNGLWRRLGFEAVSDKRLAAKLESYGPGARYMVKRI